jgi:hypothetical protein
MCIWICPGCVAYFSAGKPRHPPSCRYCSLPLVIADEEQTRVCFERVRATVQSALTGHAKFPKTYL